MRADVAAAISHASQTTGVSKAYLQATAARESSFDPAAQAKTSSAAGLYQFIESTWLDMVDRHGQALGLPQGAGVGPGASAGQNPDQSADPIADQSVGAVLAKDDVLALRFDPKSAALMASALAKDNAAVLEAKLGRPVTDGELYTAHVMGAGDAVRLISQAEIDPQQPAADLFPKPAAANAGLFYKNGEPVSVAGLLDRLQASFDGTNAVGAANGQAANGQAGNGQFVSGLDSVGAANSARQLAAASLEGAYASGLAGFASWTPGMGPAVLQLSATVIEALAMLDAPEPADGDNASGSRQARDGREDG